VNITFNVNGSYDENKNVVFVPGATDVNVQRNAVIEFNYTPSAFAKFYQKFRRFDASLEGHSDGGLYADEVREQTDFLENAGSYMANAGVILAPVPGLDAASPLLIGT
jgi:hypothetical protein